MSNNDSHLQSVPRSPHDIIIHAHSEDSQDSINISPLNSIDKMNNISMTTTNSPHTDIAPQVTFLRSPQSGQAQSESDFIPFSHHFAPRAPSTLILADESVKCEKDPSCALPLPLVYPVSSESPLTLAFPGPLSLPQCTNHNSRTIQSHYENVTVAKPQEVTLWSRLRWILKKTGTHGPRRAEQHTKPHTKRTCAIRERRSFGSTTPFAWPLYCASLASFSGGLISASSLGFSQKERFERERESCVRHQIYLSNTITSLESFDLVLTLSVVKLLPFNFRV
ncbi:MAG: hypothetical protein BYD32DRAFT_267347 [Podila humilis]|nr:MAG: hypothetical protein BYD32DRAFT_267347 [Podila humilis]